MPSSGSSGSLEPSRVFAVPLNARPLGELIELLVVASSGTATLPTASTATGGFGTGQQRRERLAGQHFLLQIIHVQRRRLTVLVQDAHDLVAAFARFQLHAGAN